MEKLRKLSKAELIKLITAAENRQITAEQLMEKLADGPSEYWVSRQDRDTKVQGPWMCNGKPPIPFNDPYIRKRKSVNLVQVSFGDRHGSQTVEYTDNKNGNSSIVIHSTGVPFANRESDIDLGDAGKQPEVKETITKPGIYVEQPKQKEYNYWDQFTRRSGGPGLNDFINALPHIKD